MSSDKIETDKVETKHDIQYRREGDDKWYKWMTIFEGEDVDKKCEQILASYQPIFEFRLVKYVGTEIRRMKGTKP